MSNIKTRKISWLIIYLVTLTFLIITCENVPVKPKQNLSKNIKAQNNNEVVYEPAKVYFDLPKEKLNSINLPDNFELSDKPDIPDAAISAAKKAAQKWELAKNKPTPRANINVGQFKGHVLLDGTTGLNNWHVVCYEMDWTLVASRTTYTHLYRGAGYYDTISASTGPDPCTSPAPPRYRVIVYDPSWNLKISVSGAYLCPSLWNWDWIWVEEGTPGWDADCNIAPIC